MQELLQLPHVPLHTVNRQLYLVQHKWESIAVVQHPSTLSFWERSDSAPAPQLSVMPVCLKTSASSHAGEQKYTFPYICDGLHALVCTSSWGCHLSDSVRWRAIAWQVGELGLNVNLGSISFTVCLEKGLWLSPGVQWEEEEYSDLKNHRLEGTSWGCVSGLRPTQSRSNISGCLGLDSLLFIIICLVLRSPN